MSVRRRSLLIVDVVTRIATSSSLVIFVTSSDFQAVGLRMEADIHLFDSIPLTEPCKCLTYCFSMDFHDKVKLVQIASLLSIWRGTKEVHSWLMLILPQQKKIFPL